MYSTFLLFTAISFIIVGLSNYWNYLKTIEVLVTLLFLTLFFAFVITKRLVFPLEAISAEAKKFAQGQQLQKISIQEEAPYEIRLLADSLNHMASSLGQKIQTIENTNQEYQSILSSMIEAVISVNMEGRILQLNGAAKKLLKLQTPFPQGKLLEEVVRIAPIQGLFQKY